VINRSELVKIGNSIKPHGINGDISFCFTNDFCYKTETFFIFELDCIFVPFKVERYHFISDSIAFAKLKNINTINQAKLLSNKEIFLHNKLLIKKLEKISIQWELLIGFKIIDEKIGEIGSISNIDKSTINTLFIIKKKTKEILIPATIKMINTINYKQKIIYMKIPHGML
jgi:16S rRNA processing protein RimM